MYFPLDYISTIFTFLGTLMIAFAALRVHHRVLNERKIDDAVLKAMKIERIIGVLGVCMTILGFMIETFLRFV